MWKDNSFRNHSVLILSGHSDSSKVKDVLRSVGFKVEVSRTTTGFKEKLFRSNYDIAIVLENVNNHILMDNQYSAIPKNLFYTRSIALIGEDYIQSVSKYVEQGFDDVYITPIDTNLLILRLKNLLRMTINRSENTFNRGSVTLQYDTKELRIENTKIFLSNFEALFIKNLIYSNYISSEILIDLINKETGELLKIINLRVKVHRLKKKIFDQSGYKPVRTRKNHGYYLVS